MVHTPTVQARSDRPGHRRVHRRGGSHRHRRRGAHVRHPALHRPLRRHVALPLVQQRRLCRVLDPQRACTPWSDHRRALGLRPQRRRRTIPSRDQRRGARRHRHGAAAGGRAGVHPHPRCRRSTTPARWSSAPIFGVASVASTVGFLRHWMGDAAGRRVARVAPLTPRSPPVSGSSSSRPLASPRRRCFTAGSASTASACSAMAIALYTEPTPAASFDSAVAGIPGASRS